MTVEARSIHRWERPIEDPKIYEMLRERHAIAPAQDIKEAIDKSRRKRG